jgi:hypothetical protein
MTDGEWGAEDRRRRRAASRWPCPAIALGALAVLALAVLAGCHLAGTGCTL